MNLENNEFFENLGRWAFGEYSGILTEPYTSEIRYWVFLQEFKSAKEL